MLHGIDIASWQAGIDVAATSADFVIVKATGGTSYTNPYWRQWAEDTLAAGKLLGLYHFAHEYGYESAYDEARHFIDTVADFKGKFIPILDWEGEAIGNGQWWAKEWLDTVASELGATPWFYGYASDVNSSDYSGITNYPLWMASYLYRYDGADFVDNPDQTWDTGAWSDLTAYQYTSTGDIDGYDGNLDLSVFYGTREDWEKMCGATDDPINNAGMKYRAHSENVGWQEWKRDGQIAGTTGRALRLEALQIDPPEGWELTVRPHIANIGWETFEGITHGNDIVIGTTGQSLRMEDLIIEVVKRPEGDNRKLYFMVHQEIVGWKGWTEEGFASGTDGMGQRLEAIRIKIE